MINEVLSNNFNININKVEGEIPPIVTKEVISNSFNININKSVPVTGISIHPKTHNMGMNEILQIETTVSPSNATNKNVTWSSSNSSIASVDNGKVTAITNGVATITATTQDGGFKDICQITVENHAPIIGNVVVNNETNRGTYTLTYIASDRDMNILRHRLKFNNDSYAEISPTKQGDTYTYNGSGLAVGVYQGKIEISDGELTVESGVFTVIIPESSSSIKAMLKQAKDNYDVKHSELKSTINSVISDGIFDRENESNVLDIAFNNYNSSLSAYKEWASKSIDAIAKKKSDDAESNSKKHTEAQIKVVSDAISLKVSQTEYDKNNNAVNEKFSEIKQTTDGITSTVSKKVGKDEVVSSINQTAEEIKIKASKIDINGAVSITNPQYEDRYILIEKDNYSGINENLQKMSLGFKSPLTGQSDNAPVIALGHKGIGLDSPYIMMQDYPSVFNPIGSEYAFSEIAYQFYKNKFTSLRFLGTGAIELNTENYLSVGTYQSGNKREELVHIQKKNGKGCIGVGSIEAEYVSAVGVVTDVVSSDKSLIFMTNDKGTGIVFYDTGTKSFEPMNGQGGQIYNGSSWSPWKGVYSNNSYSSDGVVVNETDASSLLKAAVDNVIDKIKFISPMSEDDKLIMDVTDIKDTNFIDVDEFGNVNKNDSELIKLLILEVQKLKNEVQILKQNKLDF